MQHSLGAVYKVEERGVRISRTEVQKPIEVDRPGQQISPGEWKLENERAPVSVASSRVCLPFEGALHLVDGSAVGIEQ